MKIVLAALLPAFAAASGGVYSYDPENSYGPENWAKVDVSSVKLSPVFC